MDVIGVVLRWTHIASMAFVVGCALYARLVLTPAMEGMTAGERTKLEDRAAGQLRGIMIFAVVLLMGSGLINLMRKTNLPAGYHMWFGIKMLLALHVIAVSILLGRTGVENGKRTRQLTGIVITALLTIAISAYLRALQQ